MGQMAKPRWGLLEIIGVYIGIIVAGLLFGQFSPAIRAWLEMVEIGNPGLALFAISYFFQFAITVLLVLFFTVGLNWKGLSELGVRNVRFRDYLYYGFLGGFLLMVLIIGLSMVINFLNPEIKPQMFEDMLRSAANIGSLIVLMIMGSVLAPLCEELYYRGMVYPVFRFRLGPFWGAVVAGLLFGLVHWDLWRAIPLAVGGAVLCYIYEKSGSILVSALAHGVWNGIMALMVYCSFMNL